MSAIAAMHSPRRPLTMVALGDSLTAGSQDGTTTQARQEHGWAQLVAAAADVPWNPAYVSSPGVPFDVFARNTADMGRIAKKSERLTRGLAPLALFTYYIGAPPLLPPVWDWLGEGRPVRPHGPQTNFAVPGFESRHLLSIGSAHQMLKEIHQGPTELAGIASEVPNTRAVLGTAHLYGKHTPVDRAVAANPDVVLLWAGGNDSLHAAFAGYVDDRSLTPMDDRRWKFWDKDPISQKKIQRTTRHVIPGFESSWLGPNGIVPRLLRETTSEIALLTVPETRVVAALRPLGEKVGPLPFSVVLPDGTDVTHKLENWVLPTAVNGDGHNGRTEFPPGTSVPIFTVLGAFLRSGEVADEATLDARLGSCAAAGLFGEDDVVDPDELKEITARVGQYNDVLRRAAALDKRIHLIDVNAILADMQKNGRHLRGADSQDVVVTTTFTGVQDRGMEGMFSFDGVHPSDTGHAVIANFVLDRLRQDLGADPRFAAFANAAPIDEKQVFASDPHRSGAPATIVLDPPHVAHLRHLV